MPPHPVIARPASTVLVIRDNPHLEVLMVRRPQRGFFGGLMVFPGGAIEDCDAAYGSDEDAAYRVAGLRETAEEVGFVLTDDGFENAPELRGADLLDHLAESGIDLGLARLTLVSRWITPPIAPKRFDTRFYLAPIDGDPDIRLDTQELEDWVWVRPNDALSRRESGDWSMILPTISHLRWLERQPDVLSAVSSALGADGLTIIEPIEENGHLAVRYRGDI